MLSRRGRSFSRRPHMCCTAVGGSHRCNFRTSGLCTAWGEHAEQLFVVMQELSYALFMALICACLHTPRHPHER